MIAKKVLSNDCSENHGIRLDLRAAG